MPVPQPPPTSAAPPRTRLAPRQLASLALCLLAPCVWPAAPAHAQAGAQPLTLMVGAQHELNFTQGVERIAIANETVANVTVTGQRPGSSAARLLVSGKAPGTTTLMVWEKGRNIARTYLLTVQRRDPKLEGALPDVAAHQQARATALSSAGADARLLDRSVVDVKSHTVQVDVKVVEFNRSVLKEAGFKFSSYGPNSHGFSFNSLTPGGLLSDAFGLVLGFGNANKGRGLNLTLSLMEGNGMARVLAEPTLVAMSGQSASFLAGGELPIPVPQGLGTTSIEYKPFGVGLTVTPTVLANDRIALKVAPEASDLDYANALNLNGVPVPAISTRRADTTVELGDGESFIIGGLVSRTTASNANQVPYLGDLPIIGNFFKQNTYKVTEKELVIVVTPHLVKPIARGANLNPLLPGQNEQRDAPAWRSIFLGVASPEVLPGFSR